VKKILFLFLLFPLLALANDCVPLTFEQLSFYIHKPVSYEIWKAELMPQNHAPDLLDALNCWNKRMPNNNLICIYISKLFDPGPLIVLNDPIRYKKAYVWIGYEPKKFVVKADEEVNAHCGLVFFDERKIVLITTEKPRSKDSSAIQVQELTTDEFWGMTFMVFEVVNDPHIDYNP
jgi:hypothetical protein